MEDAVIKDPQGRVRMVRRSVDTCDMLYRRGQIDARQRQAAATYRDAADICRGSIPCPLDMDRVRGSGTPSPTETQLAAANTLADAARILGLIDGRICYLVICDGHSIEDVAGVLFGVANSGKPTREDSLHVGRRLRVALTALADHWIPLPNPRIQGMRTADDAQSLQTVIEAGNRIIEQSRGVHATRGRIFDL